MLFKTFPALVKATEQDDGLEPGQFEAIVSVFDNVDSYGDVVRPGAFTDTLAEWAAKGDPIPVYYSHRMDDPDYNIGYVLEAREVTEGLWVKGQLDLDDEARKARQVNRLMKGRRLTQFSFAYDIVDAGWVTVDEEEFFELRKLRIHEVGPTPIGANQETELLAVKAAGDHAARFMQAVKDGRVMVPANENTLLDVKASLDAASKQITDVLAATAGEAGNDTKATADEPAKDEEPNGAKSEEPTRPSPAEASALLSIQFATAD